MNDLCPTANQRRQCGAMTTSAIIYDIESDHGGSIPLAAPALVGSAPNWVWLHTPTELLRNTSNIWRKKELQPLETGLTRRSPLSHSCGGRRNPFAIAWKV